jgi:hypothetical protein
MEGSLLILALLLVGFLVLGLLALGGGVDSRELDIRFAPGSGPAEGD